jgi:hypothetical protein
VWVGGWWERRREVSGVWCLVVVAGFGEEAAAVGGKCQGGRQRRR